MPITPTYIIAILTLIPRIVNSFRKNTNFAREAMQPISPRLSAEAILERSIVAIRVADLKIPGMKGTSAKMLFRLEYLITIFKVGAAGAIS